MYVAAAARSRLLQGVGAAVVPPGLQPRAIRYVLLHAIDGAQQSGQPEIDEIDARDAQHDIAVQHDAFVQQLVEQIEERRVARVEHGVGWRVPLCAPEPRLSAWCHVRRFR